MNDTKHWTLDVDDGIASLTLDQKGSNQNVLSGEVLNELEQLLDQVDAATIKGLIIKSGKQRGFIAGADVSEFRQIDSIETAKALLQRAHAVFDRIEALSCPSVAQINGVALGGGLELALACRYRVALDDPGCRLGLPEVKLGIHPGFGGTVRLIERCGAATAMDLMLSGRTVIPKQAKKMGFVDLVVPERQLDRAVKYLIEHKPPISQPKTWTRLLRTAAARQLLAAYLEKQVAKKASPKHYPAPFAIIDLWRQHGGDRKTMLAAEQDSIARLLLSPTSRNLTRVFFLQEGLKRLGKTQADETFSHLHVIGAGAMGGDIAAWSALRGLTVTIQDQNHEALARAGKRAYQLFKKKLRDPRLVQAAMDRFQADIKGEGARRADVIIEAIFENAEAKIDLFVKLQQIAHKDAILATNTSSIPLETISHALKQPGRLVGLHFFNPVAVMQLVEIVNGQKTFQKVSNRTAAFAKQINRLPVPVKSSPGFLVNRILMPYLLEAVEMVKEGIPGPVIDKAAKDFGMPMGPITLADNVGLDICYHVAENLTKSYGGEVPIALKQKIDAGQLGKKTGQGFYTWSKGRPKKQKVKRNYVAPTDLTDRLIFRYLNETVACLHEGIVENSDHLDASLIFGTGFAPFRGGPVQYIKDNGQQIMFEKLQTLQLKHGDRFKPNNGWTSLEL